MSFSFIHTSDIHLGRAFSDLSIISDKMQLCEQACEKSFNKIVDLAINKKADFVLIAGDSFDNNEHDLHTKLIFIKNLKRLADNGIASYVICGNHDPIELYKKHESYFKFDEKYNGLINITGVTTENHIHQYFHNENIVINSISFKTEEGENPTTELKTLEHNNNCFHIGLIHCDLEKNESKYAPCSKEDLKSLDYNYYALGHIHIPEERDERMIYAGSPQGRTKKETGEHGCYYVCVDGNDISKEFVSTDVIQFNELELNCSEYENKIEVFEAIKELVNEQTSTDIELNLFEIKLIGITNAYKDLNDTESLIEEYTSEFDENSNHIGVYKIENNTIPNIDENILLSDTGIIGIITNAFNENSEIDIENIYENIKTIHENIYKKLGLDNESKTELINALTDDKNIIIKHVEHELKSLCKEIYEQG